MERRGRIAVMFQWAAPIVTLALIPKCPACVAAYVLLFTGVGMSFHAAAAVRWTLMGLCVAWLVSLGFGAARRRSSASRVGLRPG